jgi:hypothetical protein
LNAQYSVNVRSVSFLIATAALAACAAVSGPVTTENQPVPTTTDSGAATAEAERAFLESLPGYIVTYDTSPTVYSPAGVPLFELAGAIPGAQPTFSGDGSLVWTASDGVTQFVRIRRADGTTLDLPPPMIPFYYYWSPDGASLAFLGNGLVGQIEVAIANRLGEIILNDGGTTYFFDWAPDGTAIAAHVSGDILRIYPLDSDQIDVAVSPNFGSPQWSPDGITWLADGGSLSASVSASALQTTQTLLVGDPTGDPTEITQVNGNASFASSAGRVAVLDGLPVGSLKVIDGVTVTAVSENVGAYQWSPDGSALAFLQFFPQEELARWLIWTGDDTLAFDRFVPTPQFMGTYLPFWDQYMRNQTIWSPDGAAFVHSAATANGFEILIQPAGAGRPAIAVAAGGFASWGPVSFAP